MAQWISILIAMILVNNYVLAQFLGICPFLGVSKKLDSAVGMGTCNCRYMANHADFERLGNSVLTDNRIYPYHCCTRTVRRNGTEEIHPVLT